MIHADSAFRIGKTHLICQDYATVSTGELPCVLLADGCSGSSDTDFGARLLVRAALAHLPHFASGQEGESVKAKGNNAVSSPSSLPDCEFAPDSTASFHFSGLDSQLKKYHRNSITTALCHAVALGLDATALDSTLLTLAARGSHWFASVFGDGVVVAKNRRGGIEVTVVSYPGGYPYYVNYEADPARKQVLLQQKNNQRQVEVWELTQNGKTEKISDRAKNEQEVLEGSDRLDRLAGQESSERLEGQEGEVGTDGAVTCPPDAPCHYVQGRVSDYAWVALLSDGIHSFSKTIASSAASGNVPIPLEEVLRELLAFKTMTGQFVQRRVQRFQQDCARKNWQHHDDISLGVLCMGDGE